MAMILDFMSRLAAKGERGPNGGEAHADATAPAPRPDPAGDLDAQHVHVLIGSLLACNDRLDGVLDRYDDLTVIFAGSDESRVRIAQAKEIVAATRTVLETIDNEALARSKGEAAR